MSNEQKLCKSFFIYFSTMTQFACQCLWDEYLCCFYSFLAVISFVQPYGVWIFFFRIIASIFTEHGFVSFGCAALVIVASRHNQNREQFTLFVSVCINLSQETNQRVSTGPTRNHHDTTTWFSSGSYCRFSRRCRCPVDVASPDSCSTSTIY